MEQWHGLGGKENQQGISNGNQNYYGQNNNIPVDNYEAIFSPQQQYVAGDGYAIQTDPQATQHLAAVEIPQYAPENQDLQGYHSAAGGLPCEPEHPKKDSNVLGKILVVIIVILSLLIISGIAGGVAYYNGWISFGASKSASSSEEDSSIDTDASAGEESTAGKEAEANSKDKTKTIDKNKDSTDETSDDAKNKDKQREDDESTLNIPPTGAKEVQAGVKKLNDDATDPFSMAVADEVHRRSFSPNSEYYIDVYSSVIKKTFQLRCNNPSSKKGWVQCKGIDTRGEVQIWVRAQ